MSTVKKTFITDVFSNAILNWVLGNNRISLDSILEPEVTANPPVTKNAFTMGLGKAGSIVGTNDYLDISDIPSTSNSATDMNNAKTRLIELNGATHLGYKRCKIPRRNNNDIFLPASNKTIMINAELTFDESKNDWTSPSDVANDKIRVWGLFNDTTQYSNSQLLLYGHLQHPRNIEIETTAIIPAGENQIRLDICNGKDDGADEAKCDGSATEMFMSDYASNMILDYIFRNTPATVPTNYYLGISTQPIAINAPDITNANNLPGEPRFNTNGYERLQLPNNKTTFTTAGSSSNNNRKITFAQPSSADALSFNKSVAAWTGRGANGNGDGNSRFTHFFIADNATGGNIWWAGEFKFSRFVDINTILTIKPGDLGFIWRLTHCHLSDSQQSS